MEFKQFFKLNEIADFATRDTSGVEIKGTHDRNLIYQADYTCREENPEGNLMDIMKCREEKLKQHEPSDYRRQFEVGGNKFEVHLKPYGKNLSSSSVGQALSDAGASEQEVLDYFKNVFYLAFEGPAGYSTTKAMTGAAEIYTQLLLTIKKLAEGRPVEGLVFTPYEDAMGLVYARFIKNFTDFQMVDHGYGLYLSKKLIDRMGEKYPMVLKFISKASEDHAEELRRTRERKAKGRNEERLARDLIGKIIVFDNYGQKGVGLVHSFSHGYLSIYYMGGHGMQEASISMGGAYRVSDFPEMRTDVAELKAMIQQGRTDSFHPARYASQVVGDHEPYTGPLPSDQWNQRRSTPSEEGTPGIPGQARQARAAGSQGIPGRYSSDVGNEPVPGPSPSDIPPPPPRGWSII